MSAPGKNGLSGRATDIPCQDPLQPSLRKAVRAAHVNGIQKNLKIESALSISIENVISREFQGSMPFAPSRLFALGGSRRGERESDRPLTNVIYLVNFFMDESGRP